MAKKLFEQIVFSLLLGISSVYADGVSVIGHPSLPKVEEAMVRKLFTGKVVEISGLPVTVVNLAEGNAHRARFLAAYLGQDEQKYRAYWTVRRFIGQGVPPIELATAAEVIAFVESRPGAIGYVDSAEVRLGMNVLLKK